VPTIFLNGSFVPTDHARISAFDAGFQHGVGLFETLLASRGAGAPEEGEDGARTLFLDEHLGRMARSARGLGLTEHLRVDPLAEAVRRVVRQGFIDDADAKHLRVRLTLTGGDLNMLETARGGAAGPAREQTPTLLIVAQRATQYPDEMFARGVRVSIADMKANPLDPFAGHKVLNYWGRLRELQVAVAKRAAEALVFQVTNHLAGGCVSNALIVKDGEVYTPIAQGEEAEVVEGGDGADAFGGGGGGGGEEEDDAMAGVGGMGRGGKGAIMPSPVLPGVTRRWALDVALADAMRIHRRMLTIDDVLDADEIVLTNSSWGALPVIAVESSEIGDGKVGAFAKRLREAWVELVG
jgi:branched-subunit amino acid aminotransferase/4-amino-4-deoxychorismate lyase